MINPVLSLLVFYYEGMLDFVKGLLYILWHNVKNYIFKPIYIIDHIYLFAYVESYLYAWDKVNMTMMDDILMYALLSL